MYIVVLCVYHFKILNNVLILLHLSEDTDEYGECGCTILNMNSNSELDMNPNSRSYTNSNSKSDMYS